MAPSRKACLNGDVMPDRHPSVPVTPDELAVQARAVMDMLAGPGGEPVTGNADLFAWC